METDESNRTIMHPITLTINIGQERNMEMLVAYLIEFILQPVIQQYLQKTQDEVEKTLPVDQNQTLKLSKMGRKSVPNENGT